MSPEAVGDQKLVTVTQKAADLAKELAESFTLGGHEYTRKYEVTRVSSRRHELSRNLLKALEAKPAAAAEAPAPKVSIEMERMRKAKAEEALEKIATLTKEKELLRSRVESLESELREVGALHEAPEKEPTSLTVTAEDDVRVAELKDGDDAKEELERLQGGVGGPEPKPEPPGDPLLN